MLIRNMFADDINRKINGVIKVDQSGDEVIEQEVREYVITNELKKHFMSFFSYYSDAFDEPTAVGTSPFVCHAINPDLQHDLAYVFSVFQDGMRLFGLGDGQHPIDSGAQGASL